MDPDKALEELRDAARRYVQAMMNADTRRMDAAGMELADGFTALDEFLSKGGYFPKAWCAQARNGVPH
jgi:hypothetical protein